jgi:signal transduction histidine kinase
MNPFHVSILFAFIVNLFLGGIVFFAQKKRLTNKSFLLLSMAVAAWLICLGMGSRATSVDAAMFWIRQASAIAASVPVATNLLRLAIIFPEAPWRLLLNHSRWWLVGFLLNFGFCQTPFFLTSAVLPVAPHHVATPIYGPGFGFYAVYLLAMLVLLIGLSIVYSRKLRGIQRIEIQFTCLGYSVGISCTLVSIVIPLFGTSFEIMAFMPLSVFLFDGIVAYGIATRRIMDIPHLLTRLISFSLLILYLVLLYFVVWFVAQALLVPWIPKARMLAHLLAALAMAFSLTPMYGFLRTMAMRMLLNVNIMDDRVVVEHASRLLGSISTLDDLLRGFADLVAQSMGTARVVILLAEKDRFIQRYPQVEPEVGLCLPDDDPIVAMLRENKNPLVVDLIQRYVPRPVLVNARARLENLHTEIAVGIHSKNRVEGVMLLAPRFGGRIYGIQEQRTLQLLCDHLAISLENSRLYTQVQNSKIYNDILLDHLASGVVAVNNDRKITVLNREGQRITGRSVEGATDGSIQILPTPLVDIIEETFRTGREQRNRDLAVQFPNAVRSIRVDSSLFHSHAGQTLGVLLVFHDITALHELEQQLRRADRLAALGTISAGMAHEIKNPLVTIKTFTQLLPERYLDPDFRGNFLDLVNQEVQRIDRIVNQLLNFARPVQANRSPIHLHEVIRNSLKLVHQRLGQGQVVVTTDLSSGSDRINGDAALLSQALVNFYLNALEAMPAGGGRITVTTRPVPGHLRVEIRDAGTGIKAEDIPRIFDPFFTTKSQGTGLGLSVAHGIIQEHQCAIQVESQVGQGTAILIDFPLLSKEGVT